MAPLKHLRSIILSHDLGAAENDPEPRCSTPEPSGPSGKELEDWMERETKRLESAAKMYASYIPSLESVMFKQSGAKVVRNKDGKVERIVPYVGSLK